MKNLIKKLFKPKLQSKSKDSETSKITRQTEDIQKSVKKQENQISKKTTFQIDKNTNFSEWYTDIIKKAELADLRGNIKGMIVFQPWSVLAMEKMYSYMEKTLQKKDHKPYCRDLTQS